MYTERDHTMKYPYLLFDADDTLFDFPKASSNAFTVLCQTHGIPDTPDVRQLYHEINAELWAAFDRGEVTKEFLTVERYVRFLSAFFVVVPTNELVVLSKGDGEFYLLTYKRSNFAKFFIFERYAIRIKLNGAFVKENDSENDTE